MLVITEEIGKTYVKAKLIFKSKQLSSGMAELQLRGVQICAHNFDIGTFYQLSIETRILKIGQYLAEIDN